MIKVTIGGEPQKEKEIPFPKLMKNDVGEIFFMVREKYGLPLNEVKTVGRWGYRANDFANFSKTSYTFTDFNEPITLQNITE